MVIRCERCSTLYELEEALLAPEGSPVQCTRCEHVFTAFPSGAPGRTLLGVPAAPAPASMTPPPAAVTPACAMPAPAPTPPPAAGPDRFSAPEPRVVRAVPPPVYRAPSPPPPGARAAPILRRDAVGTFESRLRWSARWKWLAPAAVGVVVAALAGGWFALRNRTDATAERARAEGLALVALDDGDSLDRALSRFDDALGRSPPLRVAGADRALAQLLRASAIEEDAQAAAASLRDRTDERERLLRDQPPGWEELGKSMAEELRRLEPEARALEERSRALSRSAHEALRALESELGDDPAVARALAAYHALAGERERALRVVRAAREAGRGDPWLDVTEATLELRAGEVAARERAIAKLAAVVAKHPELLRARYLLARAQAALGRRTEASAAAAAILSANPRHEGARRLRDALAAPLPVPPALAAAPAPVAAVVVPAGPAVNPAPSPRNAVAQPAKPVSDQPPARATPEPSATPAPLSAARSPAAAEVISDPRPGPASARVPTALPVRDGALAPALVPEADPQTGAPLVAPPTVRDEVSGSRSAYQDDTAGGG